MAIWAKKKKHNTTKRRIGCGEAAIGGAGVSTAVLDSVHTTTFVLHGSAALRKEETFLDEPEDI